MLKNEMNLEMRSVALPEFIATYPNSVQPKMANEEMNVEMRLLFPLEFIVTQPKTVQPKMANEEVNVVKENEYMNEISVPFRVDSD